MHHRILVVFHHVNLPPRQPAHQLCVHHPCGAPLDGLHKPSACFGGGGALLTFFCLFFCYVILFDFCSFFVRFLSTTNASAPGRWCWWGYVLSTKQAGRQRLGLVGWWWWWRATGDDVYHVKGSALSIEVLALSIVHWLGLSTPSYALVHTVGGLGGRGR